MIHILIAFLFHLKQLLFLIIYRKKTTMIRLLRVMSIENVKGKRMCCYSLGGFTDGRHIYELSLQTLLARTVNHFTDDFIRINYF
jgi:hypothetical protein